MSANEQLVVIIGASFAGLIAAASLPPSCTVVLVEKASTLGAGTSFVCSSSSGTRVHLGSAIMSMNISENAVQTCLGKLSRVEDGSLLGHLDDGLLSKGKLSRTFDRPQGWNRVFGQWEHYLLATSCSANNEGQEQDEPISKLLSSLVDEKENVSVRCNVEAVSIEAMCAGAGERQRWKVILREGYQQYTAASMPVEEIEATTVIICTPAAQALKLLRSIPVHTQKALDNRIWDVLERVQSEYTIRYACLLKIVEGSSIGRSLMNKFKDAWTETDACELDVTTAANSNPPSSAIKFDSNCTFSPLLIRTTDMDDTYVLQYTSCTDDAFVADPKMIIDWLCTYLQLTVETGIPYEKEVELLETSLFHRSPNESALKPLTPLKERKCIIASDGSNQTQQPLALAPLLVAGDYCEGSGRGTVSGAMQSGERAAYYAQLMWKDEL